MIDIINHFKNKDIIFFDLSTISSIYDFYKYLKIRSNYKVISYLNYKSISNYNIFGCFIKFYYRNNYKISNNTFTYFYKNKFLFCSNKIKSYDKNLIYNIESILLSDNKFDCNICFDVFYTINTCYRCNFQYCNKCHIKLKEINKNYSCCMCKFNYLCF